MEKKHRRQKRSALSAYEVEQPLGRGSSSFVYRAKSRESGECVAIKVLEKSDDHRADCEVEIQSLLNHNAIVQIKDSFEDETNKYIVLEYCPGGELYTKVKNQLFSEPKAKMMLTELLEALEHMHREGVVHRDIKLGNILLTADSKPKVSDFGLATRLACAKARQGVSPAQISVRPGRVGSSHTKEEPSGSDSYRIGTPAYWAPEVVQGGNYSDKSDVWAAGCVYFALLTGKLPFEGKTLAELCQRICTPLRLPKELPPASRVILSVLLAPLNQRPSAKQARAFILKKEAMPASSLTDSLRKAKSRFELNRILKASNRDQAKKHSVAGCLSPFPRIAPAEKTTECFLVSASKTRSTANSTDASWVEDSPYR